METPTGFYFKGVRVRNGVSDDIHLFDDYDQVKILVGGLEKLSELDQVVTACASQGFRLDAISAPPSVVQRLFDELVQCTPNGCMFIGKDFRHVETCQRFRVDETSGIGCVPRGCVGDVHNETCPKFKGGAALALLGAASMRHLTNEMLVLELERRRVTFDYGRSWMAERDKNSLTMLFTKDLSKGQGIRFRVPFELLAALNIEPRLDELERRLAAEKDRADLLGAAAERLKGERDAARRIGRDASSPKGIAAILDQPGTLFQLPRLETGRGLAATPEKKEDPIAHLDVDLLCDDE